MRKLVRDIGEAGMMLSQAFGHIARGHIQWREVIHLIDRFGVGSIPIDLRPETGTVQK